MKVHVITSIRKWCEELELDLKNMKEREEKLDRKIEILETKLGYAEKASEDVSKEINTYRKERMTPLKLELEKAEAELKELEINNEIQKDHITVLLNKLKKEIRRYEQFTEKQSAK